MKLNAKQRLTAAGKGGFMGDELKPAQAKAAKKELLDTAQDVLGKIAPKAMKLGAPMPWLKKYIVEYAKDEVIDGVLMGDMSLAEGLKELKSITAQSAADDYHSENQASSIAKVKQQGAAMAAKPDEKVRILEKLGLTGPEFHALCIMIREAKD